MKTSEILKNAPSKELIQLCNTFVDWAGKYYGYTIEAAKDLLGKELIKATDSTGIHNDIAINHICVLFATIINKHGKRN